MAQGRMASWLCCCCSGREASVRPLGPQTSSETVRLTEERETTPTDPDGVGFSDVMSQRPSQFEDDIDGPPSEAFAQPGGNVPPEAEREMIVEDIEGTSQGTSSSEITLPGPSSTLEQKQKSTERTPTPIMLSSQPPQKLEYRQTYEMIKEDDEDVHDN